MPLLEDAKEELERLTGIWRPRPAAARKARHVRRAEVHYFEDDGRVPNNPVLPLVIYRDAIKFGRKFDPAAIIEELFAANGWHDSWRDSIYEFEHFHSTTHEALGIARGDVRIAFGGTNGEAIDLQKGDVVILPAGTSHKKMWGSDDLLVVGAYPEGGTYDERRARRGDRRTLMRNILRVPLPACDPVYGRHRGLSRLWRAKVSEAQHS